MIERAFEVGLSIPDNEAYTALATLQRLGVQCANITRADVHVFGVDENVASEELFGALKTIATIYNPNKHRLRALSEPRPGSGEVWITANQMPEEREHVIVGGVRVPGARTAWRATSWRLLDARGKDVAREILDYAVETLLCNPAFQRAIKT
jgi:phosphoribosylformylglycinamidine (FGAM) synthase PurS component